MKRKGYLKILLSFLVVLLAIFLCATNVTAQSTDQEENTNSDSLDARVEELAAGERVPGVVMVTLKDGVAEEEAYQIFAAHGFDRQDVEKRYAPQVYALYFSEEERDIESVIRELVLDSNVVNASANIVAEATETWPNDERFENQWNLHSRFGPISSYEGTSAVCQAWDREKGNGNVTVAVIDTGLDFSHEDLPWDRIVSPMDFDGTQDGARDELTVIPYGHGTHMAGIIAAMTDNTVGVSGICWQGVKIMPIDVFFEPEGSLEGDADILSIVDAIYYAVDNGADVINMSFRFYEGRDELKDAVQYAQDKSVLVVASTGNEGIEFVGFPARYPEVVAVAANYTSTATHCWFSNRGPEVEISAPGADIWSTVPIDYREILNEGPDPYDQSIDGYARWSGTSMSTAHVSAVAALMLSHNPYLGPKMIRKILTEEGYVYKPSDLDPNELGAGILDADCALQYVENPPQPAEKPNKWYFAEGYTEEGFHEYVCVQNPNSFNVTVDFKFMTSGGPTYFYSKELVPYSRDTLHVNEYIKGEVSVEVQSDHQIFAERAMYWLDGDYKIEGHACRGVSEPKATWYFAEGCTNYGFQEFICLQNPTDNDASVKVTWMSSTGYMKVTERTVPAHSRHTVFANGEIDNSDISATVTSDVPIVAERAMYWDFQGTQPNSALGGSCAPGVNGYSVRWFLAEGSTRSESFLGINGMAVDEWVLVQNPIDHNVKVLIAWMKDDGTTTGKTIDIPSHSRQTIHVNEHVQNSDVSTMVISMSGIPIIVERAMYWKTPQYPGSHGAGHVSEGTSSSATKWYLAEGSTAWGFSDYVLIQNPTDNTATVDVTWMKTDGTMVLIPVTVPAHTRFTVCANDSVSSSDISTEVRSTNDVGIIVERTMYWQNNQVNIMGGTCTIGIPDKNTKTGNTPARSDVTIEFDGMEVAFEDVEVAGNTDVVKTTDTPYEGAPPGYTPICGGNYYYLVSDAEYLGNLGIDINYYDVPVGLPKEEIKLFRYNAQAHVWQDITTTIDEAGMVISGQCDETGIFCVGVPASSVLGWGNNDYGQLDIPWGQDYVDIGAGWYHSLALREDGTIVGCGRNDYGQADSPEGNDFIAVDAGRFHSLALREDGSVVAWGANDWTQCDVPEPNTDFIAIAAGMYHSLGLKSDGSVVGWGYNYYEQTEPPEGNNFIAIDAGTSYSLALRSDGVCVQFGETPSNLKFYYWGPGFTAIDAGASYNLALREDGSIEGFGLYYYQGMNEIPEGNDFVEVSCGTTHCLALRSDGTIVGWGMNNHGQIDLPSGYRFSEIWAGHWYSLAGGAYGNTEQGIDVTVDAGRGIFMNFDSVESIGSTVAVPQDDPGIARFSLLSGSCYNITTTAAYSGKILVSFPYDEAEILIPEQDLKMLHYEEGSWVDVTKEVNAEDNRVIGEVDSLSAFVIVWEATPNITSISPISGTVGSEITIEGNNFGENQDGSQVYFGSVLASATSWSDAQITCTVPPGISDTVEITVFKERGTSSGIPFTVAPHIESIMPDAGPSGSEVAISGTAFGEDQGTSHVSFGDIQAPTTSWSDTQITCTVPPGISDTVEITVFTERGTSNGMPFNVILQDPCIESMTPNSGPSGSEVAISGTAFGDDQGNSYVSFGDTQAVTYLSWSDTQIVAVVPEGIAGIVPATVTTYGIMSNNVDFYTVSGFEFDSIGDQIKGQAFGVNIRAVYEDGVTVSEYQGTVMLTDSTGTIAPDAAAFTTGTSSLDVTLYEAQASVTIIAQDSSATGTSNAFNVREITNIIMDVVPPTQYSDQVLISASLSDESGGPLAGREVSFTLRDETITAITDYNGNASLTLSVDEPEGTYQVTAEFSGEELYLPSTASADLHVEKETAAMAYNGDYLEKADELVRLSAEVTGENDGSYGDISRAGHLIFEIYDPNGALVREENAPITETSPGVGEASVITDPLPANVYTVNIKIADNGYYLAPDVGSGLSVYDPEGGFITGGGFICGEGFKTFAFCVRPGCFEPWLPKGHVRFVDRTDFFNPIEIKSSEFAWMVIPEDEDKAYVAGLCEFDGQEGYILYLTVEDLGGWFENLDTIHIKVMNPEGTVVYEEEDIISGGSIKIHRQ